MGVFQAIAQPQGQDMNTVQVGGAPNNVGGGGIFSQIANQQGSQSSQNTQPTLGQGAFGNFAGNVVRTVTEPLIGLGGSIISGLEKLTGGPTPGGAITSAGAQQTLQTSQVQHAGGISGGLGDIVGTVAPYFTGVGEEEAGAKLASMVPELSAKLGMNAETLAPKVVSYLAQHIPSLAKNIGIGTLQTGDLGTGTLSGIGGEVGGSLLKGGAEYLANAPSRTTSAIRDALTPVLKPTQLSRGISGSAKAGQQFDASTMETVDRSINALHDMASSLGSKITNVVKTGVGEAKGNAARIGQTISDYAQKVVSPFLKESGVNYNFADLKKALEIVKPSESLNGNALSAYNKVRQRVISAIANKVGPEQKGISSLAQFTKTAKETGSIPSKTIGGDKDFWDARKIIDSIVDEETKGKAFGDASLAGAKAAYADMRRGFAQYLSDAFRYPGQMDKVNAANDFLSSPQVKNMDKTGWNLQDFEKQFGLSRSPTSEANQAQWDKYMSNMHSAYDAITNTTTRAVKEEGKSFVSLWAKEHPYLTKGLKYGLGAVGAGALFKGGEQIMP